MQALDKVIVDKRHQEETLDGAISMKEKMLDHYERKEEEEQ